MSAVEVGAGALVVLAVLSLVWTIMLVPVLLELRRAAVRLQEFIRTVELDLRPILLEAQATLRTANQVAQRVAENSAKVGHVVEALEEAGENIRMTTRVVRAVFGSRFIPVAGLMAGVRAGVRMLWRRSSRRRETT
jgi:uncharacterized protein YoxC